MTSILAPSKREISAVVAVLKASYPYESYEATAAKVVHELARLRAPPSGQPADALLEMVDAIDALLTDVKAAGILEALPGLARYRIDLALVQARKHLVAIQDAQTASAERTEIDARIENATGWDPHNER